MKPRIKILKDKNPDLSYLGEYTDDLRPGVWVRGADAWFEDLPTKTNLLRTNRESRGFLPYACGKTPGTKLYRRYGKQAYRRMESYLQGNWHAIGIRASVDIPIAGTTQTLRSNGTWGVESDRSRPYLQEVAREELSALQEILATLNLALTDLEIETALLGNTSPLTIKPISARKTLTTNQPRPS